VDPVYFTGCVILGALAGVLTGTVPGIHANNMAWYATVALPLMGNEAVAVFIISVALSHTFSNILPAVYIGAPEADTSLGVLPGHRMLLMGEGYRAVKISVYSSMLSLLAASALFIPMYMLLSQFYSAMVRGVPIILVGTMALLVYSERSRCAALGVLLMSGGLGAALLFSTGFFYALPMFSGLFGIPTLALSLRGASRLPQQDTSVNVSLREVAVPCMAGVCAGALVGWCPGVSPAAAGALISLRERKGPGNFIAAVSAINTANMVFNLAALAAVCRARSGAMSALRHVLTPDALLAEIPYLIAALLITGLIAALCTLWLGRNFAVYIASADHRVLSGGAVVFLAAATAVLCGPLGIAVLAASSAVGFLPLHFGVKRVHLMGCVVMPVILFISLSQAGVTIS